MSLIKQTGVISICTLLLLRLKARFDIDKLLAFFTLKELNLYIFVVDHSKLQ